MHEQQPTMPGIRRRGFLRALGLGALGLGSALGGGVLGGRLVNGWFQNVLAAPDVPRTGVAVSPTSITTADGIRIHHIQTGFVAVKQAHRSYNGPDGQGFLAIVTDNAWTEWLPITAWVIEHPEGVILIDSGDVPQASDPVYYACDPQTGLIYTSFLQFTVTPEEEIHVQLAALGIRPQDVRWVIQTHLHGDHVHGLKHFPRSEVLVSPLDYPASVGAMPCLYPDWLAPTRVSFSPQEVTAFGTAYPVTRAGDVLIVPTPGHTPGHQSVLLRAGERSYLFAGDSSFDEAQLLNSEIAGIAAEPSASRRTLETIRAYAAAHPTVYLPSHDHESTLRLREGRTVSV
jgi:glyoxylase-like metal-dependent hydrolase (beta-lactamase superfamily II)